MARWKLCAAAYLHVPDETWEYKEIDRATGRSKRIELPVPRLLDPNDPSCWTTRWGNRDLANENGEVIVCWEGKGEPRDQVFIGDPTPDMVPLDDEAAEVSASFADQWSFKAEDPNAMQGFSQSLVDRFNHEIESIKTRPPEVPGLADLTAAIKTMAEQNAAVVQALTRRV